MIGRREFITLLGGAATAWPLAARRMIGRREFITLFGARRRRGRLRRGRSNRRYRWSVSPPLIA